MIYDYDLLVVGSAGGQRPHPSAKLASALPSWNAVVVEHLHQQRHHSSKTCARPSSIFPVTASGRCTRSYAVKSEITMQAALPDDMSSRTNWT